MSEDDELAPPDPQFAREDQQSVKSRTSSDRGSRNSSTFSVVSSESEEDADSDVDLSYYIGDYVDEEHGEFGHEEHVLDYTNFDGDDDSVLPGEDQLNLSVRKEGRRRRSYIRRTSMAVFGQGEFGHRASTALSVHEPSPLASTSAVRLVQPASKPPNLQPISEHIRQAHILPSHLESPATPSTATPTSATGLLAHAFPPPSPLRQQSMISSISPELDYPPRSASARPLSQMTSLSEMTDWSSHSLAALVHNADNVRLEMDEDELADISVVAERARPGRPRLERILADEDRKSVV